MNPTAEMQADSASANQLPETTLLPTDRHYRMTGERPADKPEESAPSTEIEEKPAPAGDKGEESETAAASEAAQEEQHEEQEEQQPKPRTQSRWERLSKENRELRERLARLESAAKPQKSETEQEPRPAAETKSTAEPRPKLDDVDPKTGKPKYATYEQYEAAKDDWLRRETLREMTETQARTQKERAAEEAKQRVNQEFGKRCESARKKYADFNDVALNNDLPIKEGSVVDVFILSRPKGVDVLYYLGQNPDVLETINGMNPIDAAYALSEIELGLNSPAAPKPVTRAAKPPHQTSGQGAVQKDAVQAAIDDGDSAAYRRAANERDPRLLAVRRARGK